MLIILGFMEIHANRDNLVGDPKTSFSYHFTAISHKIVLSTFGTVHHFALFSPFFFLSYFLAIEQIHSSSCRSTEQETPCRAIARRIRSRCHCHWRCCKFSLIVVLVEDVEKKGLSP